MKKALISTFLLLLGSTILGATVLREPIARAAAPIASVFVTNDASSPVPVREQNLDANGNVKIHEQGTANVNVTNSSLSVAPLSPVIGGAEIFPIMAGGQSFTFSTETATALSIRMNADASGVIFRYQGSDVAVFPGPDAFGNGSIVLALSRPIAFDEVECTGVTTGTCSIGWVGGES